LTNAPFPTQAPLTGQVAVISGAGRGIGQAIAMKLAELGVHVVLCGRSRAALEQTAAAVAALDLDALDLEKTGAVASDAPTPSHKTRRSGAPSAQSSAAESAAKSTVIECDVRDLRSVEAMAARVERTFQRLDILVNNAGISGAAGPLHQLAPDQWDQVMNTNLRGVYYCIRSLAPIMIKSKSPSGHIINISSLAGKNPVPGLAAYSASKWGLNGLTYSAAEELRAHNIRVSVICPGSVHTEFSPHPGKNEEKMLKAVDVAHIVAMLVTQAPQSFASEVLLRPTQKP
jgi:3-oxoacyl-[acyl-carrier protein] reductase